MIVTITALLVLALLKAYILFIYIYKPKINAFSFRSRAFDFPMTSPTPHQATKVEDHFPFVMRTMNTKQRNIHCETFNDFNATHGCTARTHYYLVSQNVNLISIL